MEGGATNQQVGIAVVDLIPVDVVYDLALSQWAPQRVLGNHDVLASCFPRPSSQIDIARRYCSSTAPVVMALSGVGLPKAQPRTEYAGHPGTAVAAKSYSTKGAMLQHDSRLPEAGPRTILDPACIRDNLLAHHLFPTC